MAYVIYPVKPKLKGFFFATILTKPYAGSFALMCNMLVRRCAINDLWAEYPLEGNTTMSFVKTKDGVNIFIKTGERKTRNLSYFIMAGR